jgi:hypothetical protein
MNKIKAAAYRRKVVPLQTVTSEVLICRALDILLGEGCDSPLYQKLLCSKMFQRAVDDACSDEKLAALDALPPEFQLKHLSCLYQREFFLDPSYSRSLTTFKTFGEVRHECLDLLRTYIRGWVREEGTMNHANFATVFLALYASLALLGRFRSSKRLLWNIAGETPESPDLQGYSLWLQRRAVLLLNKHEGFEKIVARMQHLRASLFWYLDLKIGLTSEQKKILRSKVKDCPGRDSVDNDFSMLEWLTESCC